jgi:hypothetical protein
LLQDGLIERRIANGIMGLESLFLKPSGEVQELSYRVRKRVAKFLANLGLSPIEVEEAMNDAYQVRNRFAHGGRLSYGEKRRLEGKYKDLKNLLRTTLEYLRMSIVALIVLPQEKEALIDLIDDALVDRKRNEELENRLSNVKRILV